MNLYQVKDVEIVNDIDEVKRLLKTGEWKIYQMAYDESQGMVHIMHKLK